MKYLFLLLVSVSITQLCAEQWYQKNNPHFINEAQFNQLITNQSTRKNGITFVKYFTPWCRYCRFIKDIFDKLKNQQWNMHFYDMNCGDQNNVNFCSHNGIGSFPHINIYQNGEYRQAIVGYYPQHVVRQIFTKYNVTSTPQQNQKKPQNLKQEQHKNQVKTNQDGINYIQPEIVLTNVHQQKKPQQAKKDQINNAQKQQRQYRKVQSTTQQARQQDQNIVVTDNNIVQTQRQRQIIEQINRKSKQGQTQTDLTKTGETNKNSTSYMNYLIYGVCIIGGLYYFSHIMKTPVQNQHDTQLESEPFVKTKQKNSVSFEQSELVEQRQFSHQGSKNSTKQQEYHLQVQDQDL